MDALEDKGRVKVAAIAPSVRVAMAEEFGLEPGIYFTKRNRWSWDLNCLWFNVHSCLYVLLNEEVVNGFKYMYIA